MFMMAIPIWQIAVLIAVVVVFLFFMILVLCFSLGFDCVRIHEDRDDLDLIRQYYYREISVVCCIDDQGRESIAYVLRGKNLKALLFWRSLKWGNVPEAISRQFDELLA